MFPEPETESPANEEVATAAPPEEASPAEKRPSKRKPREVKVKVKAKAPPQEVLTPKAEYGRFRCLVCSYGVVIAPGTPKPKMGWRCPYDFSTLQWVSLT